MGSDHTGDINQKTTPRKTTVAKLLALIFFLLSASSYLSIKEKTAIRNSIFKYRWSYPPFSPLRVFMCPKPLLLLSLSRDTLVIVPCQAFSVEG
jgi:hypothetical protein